MPLTPERVLTTRRYAMFFDGVDDYTIKSSPNGFSSIDYTFIFWIKLGSFTGDRVFL
jgi:hypothetical protein